MQDQPSSQLVDQFGRQASYLRLSITDRCDLRCTYCMSEHMTFLPRKEVLSLEELERLVTAFVDNGVRKVRLTGGEPLVRRNVMSLFEGLSRHLASGALDELTLTTNGTLLGKYAKQLVDCGVKRANVSLDTLCPQKYAEITRWGRLERVLDSIEKAQDAGLHIKINTVAVKGKIEEEIDDLINFTHGRGMDLTLIETMPLGDVGIDRNDQYVSLSDFRQDLAQRWTMADINDTTGGPSRYVRVGETGGRLGFITPMSHNFCSTCNRLRVSCTGTLYTCMGAEGSVDLRDALRASESNAPVEGLIRETVFAKPECHNFSIDENGTSGIKRHMSFLGG
ncbi:GTP 3',8-cyclase MoaA [uncultured Maritalea sp.]|jgi:cyclic pyranopterin phosphate synthase|uniref:GTP 3',8-cyclase MoaA n=1 Tax=uncultured Maritalea sp. TaxID=757249 RepID=UPI0026088192|nr:GTP 3',8-cyclase MoaA [uncultured Maritalea sp.]